ncbi:MAG: GNAT family N-acetyltransferase [Bacilli bacterium]|nr:GNAT family N-acetyltransferase [Bacilli bacterium]
MVKLYKPKINDLWFKELMLSDEETMSYNLMWGGTIPFPKEEWEDWYDYWIVNHDNKRFYRYVVDEDDNYVGKVAYHYDANEDKYLIDVIIYSKYRHKGYGEDSLKSLLDVARNNGIKIVYDNIAKDNKAISLFLKLGFIIDYEEDKFIYLKKEL